MNRALPILLSLLAAASSWSCSENATAAEQKPTLTARQVDALSKLDKARDACEYLAPPTKHDAVELRQIVRAMVGVVNACRGSAVTEADVTQLLRDQLSVNLKDGHESLANVDGSLGALAASIIHGKEQGWSLTWRIY